MSGEQAGTIQAYTLLILSKPSFMSELKRPQDYKKSLWSLGLIEMSFYTIIGATIYYYKGKDVASPALKSISPHMQKVVFGVALPVIFISGSINSQTAAKFLYDLIYLNSPKHKYMNTKQGIVTWLGLGVSITGVGEQSRHAGRAHRLKSPAPFPHPRPAWVAAEVIPSFSAFLGLVAALFTACFTFTLPACMYFLVLRGDKGRSPSGWLKSVETAGNAGILLFGVFVLVAGCG